MSNIGKQNHNMVEKLIDEPVEKREGWKFVSRLSGTKGRRHRNKKRLLVSSIPNKACQGNLWQA